MKDAIDGLKPEALWKHFAVLSQIPRCSKKEDRVRNYLVELGRKRGWKTLTDKVGNVVMRVPAKPGKENAPVVVLQAHMDMVCEKNKSTQFDFDTDAIRLVRDGDHVRADGTTLGADNGIGIAAALAVADSDLAHGPLELLFTTDEETGLTGAFGLDPDILKGRLMLNLDTEEFGFIYIGCAGGGNVEMHLPLHHVAPVKGYIGAAVSLEGLKGGHSGTDIHLNRGNAILMLARLLRTAQQTLGVEIASIEGGDKHNAIPREAFAAVALSLDDLGRFEKLAAEMKAGFETELASGHKLHISITRQGVAAQVWDKDTSRRALSLLCALPHGPLQMSSEVPGLVQTSTNVAVVRTQDAELWVQNSPRSSVDFQLWAVMHGLKALCELAGGTVTGMDAYPGWKPQPDSLLLRRALAVSEKLFGKPFTVAAIHAGLECGVIGSKIHDLDKISIGPDIRNPHSPDEYVDIPSVERFYTYLEKLLVELAG